MARSPLCRGAEQKAALKAIEEARKAYEATREKIRKGHRWDPDRTLRRVGEKVALAAARASKACASGQTKLPSAATPSKPKAAPKSRTASRPKTSRKPKAPAKAAAEVNAAKDQALIDAFSKAFAAVLGDEAPDTLTSLTHLAGTLRALGDLAGALPLQRFVKMKPTDDISMAASEARTPLTLMGPEPVARRAMTPAKPRPAPTRENSWGFSRMTPHATSIMATGAMAMIMEAIDEGSSWAAT